MAITLDGSGRAVAARRWCRWCGSRCARAGRTSIRGSRSCRPCVRSLLLAALALALARPGDLAGLLAAVGRLSRGHVAQRREQVDHRRRRRASTRSTASCGPTHSRIVAFGADVACSTTPRRCASWRAKDPADRPASGLRRDGYRSRAGAAAGARRAAARPRAAHRAVHGRPGDDGRRRDAAAAQLAADGIPVFVEPMAPRDIGDTWVDRIVLPDRLTAGGLVTATVEVGSQRAGPARGRAQGRRQGAREQDRWRSRSA